MKNFDWDRAIEATPAEFHVRVQSTLNTLPQEENFMKTKNIRRTVLIAMAAVMLLTVGVFAAAGGNIAIISGHSGPGDELPSFKAVTTRLDKGIEGLPEGVSVPETFANGFTFANGAVPHSEGRDEDGTTLTNYDSLTLRYRRGDASVDLCIDPDLGVVNEGESVSIAGTDVYLTDVTFRLVDFDYMPSDEELAAEAAGELQLTYTNGVETPEDSPLRMVTWKQDGAEYQLFSMDGLTDLDDLTAMAAELISK